MNGRHILVLDLPSPSPLREEPGWIGFFTRDQAPDAVYPNGWRIVKAKSEPDDMTPTGTTGIVLGSISAPNVGRGYFIEWDSRKREAIFCVEWKLALAPTGNH